MREVTWRTLWAILLSYAISQSVGVIPKSANPERIRQNLDCLKVTLNKDDIAILESNKVDTSYAGNAGWLVK